MSVISKINDIIYLTGLKGVKNIDEILKLEINVIVSILEYDPMIYRPDSYNGIKCIYYEAYDDDDFNIEQYFHHFNELFNDENIKILVHCHCGVSRSATLIASHLLYYYINKWKVKNRQKMIDKYDVNYILNMMRKRRSIVDPNLGFVTKLHEYRLKLLNFQNCQKIKKIRSE